MVLGCEYAAYHYRRARRHWMVLLPVHHSPWAAGHLFRQASPVASRLSAMHRAASHVYDCTA